MYIPFKEREAATTEVCGSISAEDVKEFSRERDEAKKNTGTSNVESASALEREGERRQEEGETEARGVEAAELVSSSEREGERERRNEEETDGETQPQDPTSSTPAGKSTDTSPAKKSSSFHEYLRSSGGGGGGESDRCSVCSVVSLPEGVFEGFVRHKDGSSIGVIFQVVTTYQTVCIHFHCLHVPLSLSAIFVVFLENLIAYFFIIPCYAHAHIYICAHTHTHTHTHTQVGISPEVTDEVDSAVQDPHHSTIVIP